MPLLNIRRKHHRRLVTLFFPRSATLRDLGSSIGVAELVILLHGFVIKELIVITLE